MIPPSKLFPYRSIPVLVYHQISEPIEKKDRVNLSMPPDMFMSQMKYLHDKGCVSITLDELAEIETNKKKDSRKLMAITFDDGYMDNYTNAFPILQEFGLSATIFTVAGFMGKSRGWGSDAPRQYMDWPQAREMTRAGISFQSHTCTHPDLTKIGMNEVVKEITDSRKIIEDRIGNPVRHFSYPYGMYNDDVINAVRKAGYLRSYAAGMSDKGSFVRERFDVDSKDSRLAFYFMAGQWGSWVRTIRNSLFQPGVAGNE